MSIFTYRFLQPDEYTKVDPIFSHFDWYRPSPGSGAIAVAEDPDGNIKALLTLQLVPHAEPIFCSDPTVNLFQLRSMVEDMVRDSRRNHQKYGQQSPLDPGYVIVATNEESERLAVANGMTKLEGVLYRKEVD